MKYIIIAGEQSGDLHGSNLVRELLKSDPEAEIQCWGGNLMESAGATLLMHYAKTAFMGFVSVLKNLRTIKENLKLCKKQIKEFNPDVVILIDYPGFNLRIAKFAKLSGFRIFYYISPKFWAWNEKRVQKVKRYVDKMYIIFPFEVDFYNKHGIHVKYLGNPLLDETERWIRSANGQAGTRVSLGLDNRPVIALLAGSRKHEIEHILPKMLSIVKNFSDFQFVIAGVKNIPDSLYNNITGNLPVKIIYDKTYELLYVSEAALVTSGTATLEAALFNIPQVVCYRGDFFSMLIGLMVIKVKYISLVNLILGNEAVKELVQYSLSRRNLIYELKKILPGGESRDKIIEDYGKLINILGPSGASGRIAKDMTGELESCF
jgi:lipid-A-disaccharide synthase